MFQFNSAAVGHWRLMSDAPNPLPQRAKRTPVFYAASIETGAVTLQVRLRNVSDGGAMIESDQLPIKGSTVIVRRKSTEVDGTVAWVEGRLAGVKFDRLIIPSEILGAPTATDVREDTLRGTFVSRLPADFRRPGLRQPGLSQVERRSIERLRN